jgi:hypothetical protein
LGILGYADPSAGCSVATNTVLPMFFVRKVATFWAEVATISILTAEVTEKCKKTGQEDAERITIKITKRARGIPIPIGGRNVVTNTVLPGFFA